MFSRSLRRGHGQSPPRGKAVHLVDARFQAPSRGVDRTHGLGPPERREARVYFFARRHVALSVAVHATMTRTLKIRSAM
jgi:hypothetical protein